MKPLVAIRNVRCIVRCCIKPPPDDIDGSISPSPNLSPSSSQKEIPEECMNEGKGKGKEEEPSTEDTH